ncbi:rhodanese-like domain-containing protein [Alcaligenaceae bacterium B3P038]|nr:rhodanese-like domain-containing protein [Alcaligenaceae bacterium B3P038]
MNPHPRSVSSQSSSTVNAVSPDRLKQWLHDGEEIALLDVREHGLYGESHLFYGVNTPYSRLEIEVPRLVPNRAVRVVVYDQGKGDDVAARSAQRLTALGYRNVSLLAGGIQAWRDAGMVCFAGVNVPSKTFGELAEEIYHTPRISAAELAAKLAREENMVVLDGRPFAEFKKMNIPQAVCCPNGELPLRINALASDPSTTIVINCAGRTRSIIGAQTLINLGIPNPVFALENGTQGWYLADLQLEHGTDRRYPDTLDPDQVRVQRERAERLAHRFGVPKVSSKQVDVWLADTTRTTVLCDVRTPEEFRAGSLAGAQHTPGGQLIQATDQYVGVRGARLVLFDTDETRAPAVASWLRQMGWDACVLEGGLQADIRTPSLEKQPVALLSAGDAVPPTLQPDALTTARAAGAVVIDVRPSMAFRAAHIAGAVWSIRPRVAQLAIAAADRIVLVGDDVAVVRLAAQELIESGQCNVSISIGAPDVWQAAGLPIAADGDTPPDAECIDFLFFVHDRHSGNKAAARQYLAWETDLVHQIDAQERAGFRFPQ